MGNTKEYAAQVASALDWKNAHAGFDGVIAKVPAAVRGTRPEGLPYSPWQLLEHLRIAQRDILDYCRDPEYVDKRWPDDYWPTDPEPPTPAAWDESVAAFRKDLADFKGLATDPNIDLLSSVPINREVSYLRELLLVIDHNAYHLGQLVAVLRLLGVWGNK
jgi:DinB superfamily